MKSRQKVFSVLRKTGIKGTYSHWPVGKAPQLPWFVYLKDSEEALCADNSRYKTSEKYRVELYMKNYDDSVVEKFKKAIEEELGLYDYSEVWVPSEKCIMAIFQFEMIGE